MDRLRKPFVKKEERWLQATDPGANRSTIDRGNSIKHRGGMQMIYLWENIYQFQ